MTPFDTGAYASRQSFVTGTAVKECARQLYDKILVYAKTLLPEAEARDAETGSWMDLCRGRPGIVTGGTCTGMLLQSYKLFGDHSRKYPDR